MKRQSGFIVMLALCLLLLFSTGALAAAPTEVMVNGVDLLAEGTIPQEGVAYDQTANTLTLTNAKLTQGYAGVYGEDEEYFDGVSADGDLHVVLVGDNVIDLSQAGHDFTYGLYAVGDLTISGSGSLTFIGCYTALSSDEDIIINGGVCTVKDAGLAYRSYGGSITINSGTVKAEGCDYGFAADYIIVNGGQVFATDCREGLRSCWVTVNGGRLLLEGSHAALVLANYEETAVLAEDWVSLTLGSSSKLVVGGALYQDAKVYSYNYEVTDESGQAKTGTEYYAWATIAAGDVDITPADNGYFTLTGAAKKVEIASSGFSDVLATDYFFDGVGYVTGAGLMNGVGDGLFAPQGQMTRGMLVTVLWRMAGSPAGYADKAPAKAAASQSATVYDQNAVGWAYDTGIITGYGDGTLRLGQAINREQLAAFLYRYEQAQGGGFQGVWMFKLDFADASAISDYAYEAMAWCVMNDIITGVGNNQLDPGGFATRGQMATMLQRYVRAASP